MTNSAMPVIVVLRQFGCAIDIETLLGQMAQHSVRQFRVTWITGVLCRLVPRFGCMNTGGMQHRLLFGRRFIPDIVTIEDGESRDHSILAEQLVLVVAKDDRNIGFCRRINIGHLVDSHPAQAVPPDALCRRTLKRKILVLAQFHELFKIVRATAKWMGFVFMIGRQAQQPFVRRGRQGWAMGGPHAKNDFSH